MNKAEIAYRVAAETGANPMQVDATLKAFYREVRKAMLAGERIELRGFGSFYTKVKKEKEARDIRKNISVTIPERCVVQFKPVVEFKDEVGKIKLHTPTPLKRGITK